MAMQLNESTAARPAVIITGGCGLLGRALVDHLAQRGYHVIVVDMVSVAEEVRSAHGEDPWVSYLQFDLSSIREYPALCAQITQQTSCLKGLVNNAGYNPKVEAGVSGFGSFEELELERWHREMDMNLTVPVFLTQALLPLFYHGDGAHCKIVNVISTYGLTPPNPVIYESLRTDKPVHKPLSYPVSKAGLAMVTRYLAVYLAKRGFNVNGIAPGGIWDHQPEAFVEAYSRLTPQGRMAKAEEMNATVELLLSAGSDYINGQIIAVDGGWTTW